LHCSLNKIVVGQKLHKDLHQLPIEIHQIYIFLEKEKENMSCFYSSGHFGPASTRAAQQRGPRPARRHARALSPRPGRNLGLGRDFGLVPYPAWAAALAQSPVTVHLHPTAARAFRPNKTPRPALLPEP